MNVNLYKKQKKRNEKKETELVNGKKKKEIKKQKLCPVEFINCQCRII